MKSIYLIFILLYLSLVKASKGIMYMIKSDIQIFK